MLFTKASSPIRQSLQLPAALKLVELGIPKGAAGAIIAATGGKGDPLVPICHY